MIVVNLGSEHRSSEKILHYYGDITQSKRDSIGNYLVLHGLFSVSIEQVRNLYNYGICKVNIGSAE